MSICLVSVSVGQQSVELILSFHHVGAENWVPITRLGSLGKQVPLSAVPSHQPDEGSVLEIVCK